MRSRACASVCASIVRGVSTLSVLGLVSCGDGAAPTEPMLDAAELYWALQLDQHAVTLALEPPFDTLTVTATPRNPDGAVLQGLGPVTFRSADPTRVQVSPAGVLRAVKAAGRIAVVAELRARNVTHADTVFVRVTAAAPPHPLASLSIDVHPDSTRVGAHGSGNRRIVPRVTDVNGTPFTGALVDFASSDESLARIDRATGNMTTLTRRGPVDIVASATAYGVRLADTVMYTIGAPTRFLIVIGRGSAYGASTATAVNATSVRVAAGANVVWVWGPDLPPTDLTFDDPTLVEAATVGLNGTPIGANTGAGNIPPPEGCVSTNPAAILSCAKGRRFPVPGVYRYRSTLTGATGQIIVEAEEAP